MKNKLSTEDIKAFEWGKVKAGTEITKGDILFPKIEFKEKHEDIFPLTLKAGEIEEVEDHPDADKLYVLRVNLGKPIQLVAGIKQYYSKEELVGKKIVIVSNLKPAKLRRVISQGMLLAAEDKKGKVILLETSEKPGTEIKVEGYNNSQEQIDFNEFLKVKLKIKNKEVFYKNARLKGVKADSTDDAVIR